MRFIDQHTLERSQKTAINYTKARGLSEATKPITEATIVSAQLVREVFAHGKLEEIYISTWSRLLLALDDFFPPYSNFLISLNHIICAASIIRR